MRLRAFRRAVALAFSLLGCLLDLAMRRLRGPLNYEQRALWMQSCGQRILGGMGLRYSYTGEPPRRGLLVANHISYLDICFLGTIQPLCMVSKAEISRWPLFGMMARAGGVIFVDRSSRASAVSVTGQVAQRLHEPVPVLFFPEGTSTDGSKVLRFHSRLFTPAAEGGFPVTTATIRYIVEDGTPERELCWFGDDAFLPHLWKVLGAAGFHAEITFGETRIYPDRRTAADSTHAEISALRGDAAVPEESSVV
jgi:1-acyl-sn-glycerol-3-phosphate acyltransferase